MRFIHSVWSRPALMGRWNTDDQLGKDIWTFALSAHYVKAHGHELVLHTDGAGERLFGTALPYDEVHRTLDSLAFADVFWAAGKSEALRREPVGACHIDGDVFISSPEMFDLIADDNCDLVVQGDYESDALPHLLNILRPYLVRYVPVMFGAGNGGSSLSYSCGVLRFLSQDLKDEYVNAYQKITGYLSRSNALVSMLQQDANITVDLAVEQKLLRVLAETSGSVVRKLIDDPSLATMRHVQVDGYEHAAFLSKYWELPRIQETLREVNPELYEKVEYHVERFANLPPPSTFHAVRTPGDGKGAGAADDVRVTLRVSDRTQRYAIVTPYCREGRDQIERCVQSVKDQTLPVDHFVVADGFAQDWLDDVPGVRHIKLDRNHADCGNTPRGMGALLAVAEEYDAISMLDVDNWLEPDHMEVCLATAETTSKPCDYVIARRLFHRPDGSEMNLREEVFHVDTSCFFFLRGSFCVLSYWATMPPQMSGVCDRVFYEMIRQWDFTVARAPRPTVHFTTIYLQHYQLLGEEPPPEVKHIDVDEAARWLDSLQPQPQEIARRLAGYPSRAQPQNLPRRVPKIGAMIPSHSHADIWEQDDPTGAPFANGPIPGVPGGGRWGPAGVVGKQVHQAGPR